MEIVAFFPPTPMPVRAAIVTLHTMAQPVPGETPVQAQERLDRLAELPRPWIPASCEPGLRLRLYRWLDEVAAWFNDQHCWQPRTMIPACWPRHPHIAHELAVLAILRHLAETNIDPRAIEDWHRYHRSHFTERMKAQLGDSCLTTHMPWAGRTRLHDFTATAGERASVFETDCAEP